LIERSPLFHLVPETGVGSAHPACWAGKSGCFWRGNVTNQMREPADDSRGLEVIMAAYDGLKGLRA
jgi:hypothetical protein